MTDNIETLKQKIENILSKVATDVQGLKHYEVVSNIDEARGKGEGFLSDFFTGKVVNKDNGKITEVAIKLAPDQGFFPDYASIFKNEYLVYSKLFPALDTFQKDKRVSKPFNNIPTFFCGSIDTKKEFIVMENLKPVYQVYDKTKCLDEIHIRSMLESYAKMHALSFAFKKEKPQQYSEILGEFESVTSILKDVEDFIRPLQNAISDAFNAFDPVTEIDFIRKIKKIENARKSFIEVMDYKGKYTCFSHQDCWSNNMLFKYKDSGSLEDNKIIDFQLSRDSTPIHDISYLIYSGAAKKDLDKLDSYLDLYYKIFSYFAKELDSDPEELFPFEVLKNEWKRYSVLGILLGLDMWVAKLMDKDEIAELQNKEDVPLEDMGKHWEACMKKIRTGDKFRERARGILLHAVEYGIL